MKISVAICTHNNAALLPATVKSLLSQTHQPDEILIVDNASTDTTPETVEQLMRTCAFIRYVYEPTLGLSHARNRAMRTAGGDIIVYMDDDERAIPTFIEGHMAVYTSNAAAVAAGGKILIDWKHAAPVWFPPEFESRLGKFDYGDTGQRLYFPRYPFGGNMSFKRDFLIAHNGFASAFGLKGNKRISNEEKEFFARLHDEKADHHIYYAPTATVFHAVHAKFLRPVYFYHRNYWQGISDAILQQVRETAPRGKWRWFLRGGRSILAASIDYAKGIFNLLCGKAQKRVLLISHAAYGLGRGVACIRISLNQN